MAFALREPLSNEAVSHVVKLCALVEVFGLDAERVVTMMERVVARLNWAAKLLFQHNSPVRCLPT